MQIRKFYANSLPVAMRDIRKALGADAVILSTRQIGPEDEAVIINGDRARVEVTAAREIPTPANPTRTGGATPFTPQGAEALPEGVQPRPFKSNDDFLPGNGSLRTRLLQSASAALSDPSHPGNDGLDRLGRDRHDVARELLKQAARPEQDRVDRQETARKSLGGKPAQAQRTAPKKPGVKKAALGNILKELKDLRGRLDSPTPRRATKNAPVAPEKSPAAPAVEMPKEPPVEQAPRLNVTLARAQSVEQAPPAEITPTAPAVSASPSMPALKFQEHLCGQGMNEDIVRGLIEKIHFTPNDPSASQGAAAKAARAREEARRIFGQFVEVVRDMAPCAALPFSGPTDTPKKIALVGPTGVGKTTTIAKIASHFALEENLRVVLVTLDTYRIGAVEQLQTYARLLGLPLEVINEPLQLQEVFKRYADVDLILVDTPGHSPSDSTALGRLAATLSRHDDLETHLVVTATTQGEEMGRVMERFAPMQYDRIIFSKLDEAGRLGEVLNTWIASHFEVSYFTTGQSVPEDLEVAGVDVLCKELVKR